jgi:FlaA1/EpsC-like NDP-sugar epimerase
MLNFINTLTRKQKGYVLLSIDVALIPITLLFTFTVQSLPTPAIQTLTQSLPSLPSLVAIAIGLSFWLGLPHIRLNAYERSAIRLTALLAVGVTLASALLAQFMGPTLPPGTYVIFGLSYFLFCVVSRTMLYQMVTALYRRAEPRCRVLIYGAGATGKQLVSALQSHATIDPVAFVDDNNSLQGMRLVGLPIHQPGRISELVKTYGIKRVLLAMPSLSQPKQAQVARQLQTMGLEVQALPSFAQLIGEEALLEKLTPIAPQHFLGRKSRVGELGDTCESYAGRAVLVTGAGGSIGSELCRQLLTCQPSRLVLYELNELALYTVLQEMTQLIGNTGVEIVPILGSVTDARQVRKAIREYKVQVVLHAAAYKHVPLVEANPLPGLFNNVIGTHTLARVAADLDVERFILISSDKAVRPANVMGASKRLAELVVQDLATRHKTIFSIVRFGNVLGSSGSVVPLFQEQIRRGGPVTVTDPNVKRYFMTIREAVQLVLRAGAGAKGGEIFVLDMGKPVSIMHLARQVIESTGYTVRDVDNPGGDIEIQLIGLRPGEKLEEELTLSDDLIGTRYQKIFCAGDEALSEIEVAAILRELRGVLAAGDEEVARALIRRWVEGYAVEEVRTESQ